MKEPLHYPGQELELFSRAINWKKYLSRKIKPFIGDEVLEVGAGIGASTKILNEGKAASWTLLEPDPDMAAKLGRDIDCGELPANCRLLNGTIEEVAGKKYDTILYIDVLEHIDKDQLEIETATQLLAEKGRLIVLSPAHPFLYSPFDKAIGHYRRYNKHMLRKLNSPERKLLSMQYLDSLGFMLSLGNKLLLRQSQPQTRQILFWDRKVLPVSVWVDRLILHAFGRTILAVWEKQPG